MIEKFVTKLFSEHNNYAKREKLIYKGSFLMKRFLLINKVCETNGYNNLLN